MDILDKVEHKLGIGNIEDILPPGPGEVLNFIGAPTPVEVLPTPKRVASDILPRP